MESKWLFEIHEHLEWVHLLYVWFRLIPHYKHPLRHLMNSKVISLCHNTDESNAGLMGGGCVWDQTRTTENDVQHAQQTDPKELITYTW